MIREACYNWLGRKTLVRSRSKLEYYLIYTIRKRDLMLTLYNFMLLLAALKRLVVSRDYLTNCVR